MNANFKLIVLKTSGSLLKREAEGFDQEMAAITIAC
jgi:hypothetical protein